ncbi:hypothetical protein D3C72_2006330 [compost metagenome]
MEGNVDHAVFGQIQVGGEPHGDPRAAGMDAGHRPARALGVGNKRAGLVQQLAVQRLGVGNGNLRHSGNWSKYCCRMMRAASASSSPRRAPAIEAAREE